MKTKLNSMTAEQQVRNAMSAAQWRGCDPYNSHAAQQREWTAVAAIRAGVRSRSEAQANRELAALLGDEGEEETDPRALRMMSAWV